MEGIILLLISLAIGAIFKDKKTEDKQAPKKRPVQKPQTTQQRPTQQRKPEPARAERSRSLEDYAKKVFSDLEKQFGEQPKVKTAKEFVEEKVVPVQERVRVADSSRNSDSPRSTRPAMSRMKEAPKKAKQTDKSAFNFPQTQNELVQSIMMAEILGPPKSKR
ncbi:hypothetical protein JFL43_00280 [Viridibacillus sp. YIM B01967]|uniref:Uncharacterized protein n=1 Tax=Viridibacillus soli TaxID=2798301 RepID=A0ABS1H1N3_9BACL|nr:hypothetical protein [Viridibacillus soli]MBK3493328.1 hypothetical protein [Viridibacillus soli]